MKEKFQDFGCIIAEVICGGFRRLKLRLQILILSRKISALRLDSGKLRLENLDLRRQLGFEGATPEAVLEAELEKNKWRWKHARRKKQAHFDWFYKGVEYGLGVALEIERLRGSRSLHSKETTATRQVNENRAALKTNSLERLTIIIRSQGGDWWIAICEELMVSGMGPDRQSALEGVGRSIESIAKAAVFAPNAPAPDDFDRWVTSEDAKQQQPN